MAHFAQIDKEGNVLRVVVAEPDFVATGKLGDPESFVQCSYNTRGGKYVDPETKQRDEARQLRLNYPGIGFKYRADIDGFVPPEPPAKEEPELDPNTGHWIRKRRIFLALRRRGKTTKETTNLVQNYVARIKAGEEITERDIIGEDLFDDE